MMVFTYDGSFEGLLTCIHEAYYIMIPDKIVEKSNYNISLIEKEMYIETNEEKYNKVYNAILHKLGSSIYRKIYTVYLSDIDRASTIIYRYIVLAFKVGPKINLYKHNSYVNEMDNIEEKINKEAHRFKGFVRFKACGSILYSKIDPDYNILELLMNHFTTRFNNENFIIYDEKRDRAIMYNGKEGKIISGISLKLQEVENIYNDNKYEDLWRAYFSSASIKERLNPNLQRKMMPKKYWKNIVETNIVK